MDTKPRKFIYRGEGNKYCVNQDIKAWIEKLENELKVEAIIGERGTGKSSMLNHQFGENTTWFPMSAEPTPCTEGIWIRAKPHPTGGNIPATLRGKYFVQLDVEGVEDTNNGADHDCKLLAIVRLLSNVLVYNHFRDIRKDELERLSMVTDIARHISNEAAGQSGERPEGEVPIFLLWCVRDYQYSGQVDDDEFLNGKLRDTSNASLNNKLKRDIKRSFPNRRCITVRSPAYDEAQFVEMARGPNGNVELRQEYLDDMQKVTDAVLEHGGLFTANGIAMTGPEFLRYATYIVDAVNTPGVVPDIPSIGECVRNESIREAKDESIGKYNRKMEEEVKEGEVVLVKRIKKLNHEARTAAKQHFETRTRAWKDRHGDYVEEQLTALRAQLTERNEEYVRKNKERSKTLCSQLYHELYHEVIGINIREGNYNYPGGSELYLEHLEELKKRYQKRTVDMPDADAVWDNENNLKDDEREGVKRDDKLATERRNKKYKKTLIAGGVGGGVICTAVGLGVGFEVATGVMQCGAIACMVKGAAVGGAAGGPVGIIVGLAAAGVIIGGMHLYGKRKERKAREALLKVTDENENGDVPNKEKQD